MMRSIFLALTLLFFALAAIVAAWVGWAILDLGAFTWGRLLFVAPSLLLACALGGFFALMGYAFRINYRAEMERRRRTKDESE